MLTDPRVVRRSQLNIEGTNHEHLSLSGLNKADVLAALYNASKPQGMGFLHYDPKPMARPEAEELLKHSTDFDYLKGRVMKIDLGGDELNEFGYDRDNGKGAAAKAIATLVRTGNATAPDIVATGQVALISSAEATRSRLGTQTTVKGGVATLGLDDVAHVLAPAIDRAVGEKKF